MKNHFIILKKLKFKHMFSTVLYMFSYFHIFLSVIENKQLIFVFLCGNIKNEKQNKHLFKKFINKLIYF